MENKMTPKDFFLQLGIIVTLYVSIVALISFLFTVINIALPQVNEFYGQNSDIAWSMSVFIIAYPVLVYLMFKTNKYFAEFPAKKELAIKKWFTYLTIFLTALTIAIDLIVLLYTFLQGEQITLRFILKILVVVVVALTVFWVALKDLKGNFLGHSAILKKTFLIVSIVIVALISVGFYFNGSPQKARLVIEDNQRVSDLQYIQSQVSSVWNIKETLPNNLDELNDPLNYVSVPKDPSTFENYEYKVKDAQTFEICANFKTDSLEQTNPKFSQPEQDFFKHTEGRNCFERKVDPATRKPVYTR